MLTSVPMTLSGDGEVLLVIGSGGRQYREYVLAGAAGRHPLWLMDAAEPDWQDPYIVGSTAVPRLDDTRLIPDADGLLAAADRLAARRTVAGVFTYDETLVMATARIAEHLRLPGLSVDGADRCRNKLRTRLALSEAGLPQPRFAYAVTGQEAWAAAAAIGYPMVVKPRGMGASIGVVRAGSEDEFAAAYAVAERAGHTGAPAYEGGVLIEELVTGEEISIDGAVFKGEYRPFCLAHKMLGPEPYFEEVGHVVDAADPLICDPELLRVLTQAHRALGVQYGVTHTEVKLSPRGPVVIEVNARLGGDLIPYLGKLATGLDPGAIAADLALGVRPALEHAARGAVGIRFRYPEQNVEVAGFELPDPDPGAGLIAAVAMVGPGTRLRLPPEGYLSRFAYVICSAADAESCRGRLDAAAAEVRLMAKPLDVEC
ncbi:MAG TPA: ATP-grasp domain-containing protein [Actinocrinis sp.]|jgi:biotin carboxylase